MARKPGEVRDAIIEFLREHPEGAFMEAIHDGVEMRLGPVPRSSVRSYLRLNSETTFKRLGRGRYKLRSGR
jgi:hypothetical protein